MNDELKSNCSEKPNSSKQNLTNQEFTIKQLREQVNNLTELLQDICPHEDKDFCYCASCGGTGEYFESTCQECGGNGCTKDLFCTYCGKDL